MNAFETLKPLANQAKFPFVDIENVVSLNYGALWPIETHRIYMLIRPYNLYHAHVKGVVR